MGSLLLRAGGAIGIADDDLGGDDPAEDERSASTSLPLRDRWARLDASDSDALGLSRCLLEDDPESGSLAVGTPCLSPSPDGLLLPEMPSLLEGTDA